MHFVNFKASASVSLPLPDELLEPDALCVLPLADATPLPEPPPPQAASARPPTAISAAIARGLRVIDELVLRDIACSLLGVGCHLRDLTWEAPEYWLRTREDELA